MGGVRKLNPCTQAATFDNRPLCKRRTLCQWLCGAGRLHNALLSLKLRYLTWDISRLRLTGGDSKGAGSVSCPKRRFGGPDRELGPVDFAHDAGPGWVRPVSGG